MKIYDNDDDDDNCDNIDDDDRYDDFLKCSCDGDARCVSLCNNYLLVLMKILLTIK